MIIGFADTGVFRQPNLLVKGKMIECLGYFRGYKS